MERSLILGLLGAYAPQDDYERIAKEKIIEFVLAHTDCFLRSNLRGHITASCWLMDPGREEVLLTHHKKIGEWLQLGGHADGDHDVLRAALKEAYEESAILGVFPVDKQIFDVDIHVIPKYQDVPEHLHYDIRFAFIAPHKNFKVSQESNDLSWVSIKALSDGFLGDSSLKRMAKKWLMTHPSSSGLTRGPVHSAITTSLMLLRDPRVRPEEDGKGGKTEKG